MPRAARSSPPRTADRFRLEGPSRRLDPRVNAVRADIADVALAGQVFAPHYARSLIHGCVAATTPILANPSIEARAVSELLLGERFAVVDVGGAWAWGYGLHDHYVGYVALEALGRPVEMSHRVVAPALLFAAPDIKAPVRARLPVGAAVCGEVEGDFLATADGFLHLRHVRRIDDPAPDFVTVAEALLGAPYRWGGRSGDGLDCSGLVQLALGLSGIAAPRDSDQQLALGRALDEGEAALRGDLVFFPGHVGIMADDRALLHANAFWMAVTREPLAAVLARLAPSQERPIVARRRLP